MKNVFEYEYRTINLKKQLAVFRLQFAKRKRKLHFLANCLVMLSGVEASFAQNNRLWATYYGGAGDDIGNSVVTDAAGNVYMAGFTDNNSNIASGGFQNTFGGGHDAFLVKFDASGNRLWATYYGGVGNEYGLNIATDIVGNVYLSGFTDSTSGIASGGYQNTYGGGGDAFLVKFNAAGSRLWATYYGGSGEDWGCGVATDAFGNVFLSGFTSSISGISFAAFFQAAYGGGAYDAFLVKFDATTGNRIWATYDGGPGDDCGFSVVTDAAGNVYMAGQTSSSSGIALGGFQNSYSGGINSGDAFLVKFSPNGSYIWGTYYGGTDDEIGYGVAVDPSGNIYMAGFTSSISGIASGGFQDTYGGGTYDGFLVKFNSAGNRLWATYYGGLLTDEVQGVVTDALGNVYLGGDTYSTSGIASGGFQNSLTGSGAVVENQFVAKLDANGNRLCATYYGQAHDEQGHISADGFGNVYMVGWTTGTSGIASGGFQNIYGGGKDAYLVKFTSCFNPLTVNVVSADINCNGQCNAIATANPFGGTSPYTYFWSNFQTTQTVTGLCAGAYTVTVADVANDTIISTFTITTLYATPTACFIYQLQPATILNPIQFTDSSIYNISSWLWSFGDPDNGSSFLQNPNYTYTDTGQYIVKLIVTDIHGCTDTTEHSLYITADYFFYAPNGFTPNNDGINDIFIPQTDVIISADYLLIIFDRWGNKIFESNDHKQGWNGKIKNTNMLAQQDVYVWSVNLTDFNHQPHEYTGRVTIVR